MPPAAGSAYVVSRRSWRNAPTIRAEVLYVGGNTGRSERFRTRLGDLLADIFGFYTKTTGHHSGGQSLHEWCRDSKVSPLDLWVAWVEKCACHRCLEVDLVAEMKPLLNRKRPAACRAHV